MGDYRVETDSLGEVRVPAERLWGAQTQRSLEHFDVGADPVPWLLVEAYALVKKAAALANSRCGVLDDARRDLIVKACDELLAGEHREEFPLGIWMSGSGTQLNMNVNEVISNRCCRLAGTPLGSKDPVHPNDHVNMSQSTNDTFPTAMYLAAALETRRRLLPEVLGLRDSIAARAGAWSDIVKVGRTHLQDATPLTLGQEWSGYAALLTDAAEHVDNALTGVYRLAIGGTAVGTGMNAPKGFASDAVGFIAEATGLPFVSAPDKFAVQGSHDALVMLSGAMRSLAVSLHKIADDVRLLSCGPRCGFGELLLPENEPGSSIMPGKVNPTQCEVLAMLALQVMGNDVAVGFGAASGHLQMNDCKPLIIHNVLESAGLLADGCRSFRVFLVEGVEPDLERIGENVRRSLMLVTALSPVVGYDRAAEIARFAHKHGKPLREAALELGYVTGEEFDRVVDPRGMVGPSEGPD